MKCDAENVQAKKVNSTLKFSLFGSTQIDANLPDCVFSDCLCTKLTIHIKTYYFYFIALQATS